MATIPKARPTGRPRTSLPFSSQGRIPGMTASQSMAFRRIHRLKERFAAEASILSSSEMKRIASECYSLIASHFPEDYAAIEARDAQIEERALAG